MRARWRREEGEFEGEFEGEAAAEVRAVTWGKGREKAEVMADGVESGRVGPLRWGGDGGAREEGVGGWLKKLVRDGGTLTVGRGPPAFIGELSWYERKDGWLARGLTL